MKRILLIGGGGFAKEVDEVATLCGHEIVGYVGDVGTALQRPHLGAVDDILLLRDKYDAIFIAFGAIDRKTTERRGDVAARLSQMGVASIALISPSAVVSRGAMVEDGAFVAHGVVISVDAKIGSHAILNSNAIIGHDAEIGANVTIAPGAFIGGNAKVGGNSLIGPGALVLEGRQIGEGVVVGLGATVVRDVPPRSTVMPVRSRVLQPKN
jgi:acetyltransferase EpsM